MRYSRRLPGSIRSHLLDLAHELNMMDPYEVIRYSLLNKHTSLALWQLYQWSGLSQLLFYAPWCENNLIMSHFVHRIEPNHIPAASILRSIPTEFSVRWALSVRVPEPGSKDTTISRVITGGRYWDLLPVFLREISRRDLCPICQWAHKKGYVNQCSHHTPSYGFYRGDFVKIPAEMQAYIRQTYPYYRLWLDAEEPSS